MCPANQNIANAYADTSPWFSLRNNHLADVSDAYVGDMPMTKKGTA